jgi:hypothetical protein
VIKSIVIGYLILLCTGLAQAQGGSPEIKGNIYVHGDEYTNACSPRERKKLQQSVKRAAGRSRDANGAWQLVETLLCAPNSKASRRYLTGVLPPKIRFKSSGTGQDDTSELIRRDGELVKSLLAKGEAWHATISSESTEIILSYYPNEACIRSRTLTFTNKRWRLVELGEACD